MSNIDNIKALEVFRKAKAERKAAAIIEKQHQSFLAKKKAKLVSNCPRLGEPQNAGLLQRLMLDGRT